MCLNCYSCHMAKKRYGIIVEEGTYRSWRYEAVRAGQSVGTWLETRLEAPMEKTVKKAIEPEAVKETDKGKLTKGLGEMPWESPTKPVPTGPDPGHRTGDRFGSSRPAPKPGKK